MIRRFITLSIVGGIAALGYAGAHRVGRWLDEPFARFPQYSPDDVAESGEPVRRKRWVRVTDDEPAAV